MHWGATWTDYYHVRSDAYPPMSCRDNIVWCTGSAGYDALLITPITSYDPNAAPEHSWTEILSLGAPRGQTRELVYQDSETPETLFYAGTYECSRTDQSISLTYSQLSYPVRFRSVAFPTSVIKTHPMLLIAGPESSVQGHAASFVEMSSPRRT